MEIFLYIIPSLMQLGYIAGTIFALIDLSQRDMESKVWWIIAIIFFPFAWAIYLVMSRNTPKKTGQFSPSPPQTQVPATAEAPNPPEQQQEQNAPTAGAVISAPAAVNPVVQQSKTGGALKAVGMALGIIALVSGVIMIGLFILLMAAFSSYGSNK